MDLIARASAEYDWDLNLSEMARIWKGGCIIRARFLDTIMLAYQATPALPNRLLDNMLQDAVQSRQATCRRVVALAQGHGIPIGGMPSGLTYWDSYRSASLP